MRKRFSVGTRKALLRIQWARWGAGKPPKCKALPEPRWQETAGTAPEPCTPRASLRLSASPRVPTQTRALAARDILSAPSPVQGSASCSLMVQQLGEGCKPGDLPPPNQPQGWKLGPAGPRVPGLALANALPARDITAQWAETSVCRHQALCCDKFSAVHTTLCGRDHDSNASTQRKKC